MDSKTFLVKGLSKCYKKLTRKTYYSMSQGCIYDRTEANRLILDLLEKDKPCMISRLGSGEIGVVTNYLTIHDNSSILLKCFNYITDKTGLPWWDDLYLKCMRNNMGIFPESFQMLEEFSKVYLEDIPEIDLLGSMNYTEKFMPLKKECSFVHLECLYPFFVNNPWTQALTGKKVLVVHPFVFSIEEQYRKREKLFDDSRILPEYQLILYRAIQSNGSAKVPYNNWLEALKKMEDDISRLDFDIAILGCGAYGLPLAAHIKRMGKKAIHMGGGTQLLFGIKGSRWEHYKWEQITPFTMDVNYARLFNEYWVRPNRDETPQGAQNIEGACYW